VVTARNVKAEGRCAISNPPSGTGQDSDKLSCVNGLRQQTLRWEGHLAGPIGRLIGTTGQRGSRRRRGRECGKQIADSDAMELPHELFVFHSHRMRMLHRHALLGAETGNATKSRASNHGRKLQHCPTSTQFL
jgi:hypothetical protein